MMALWFPLTNEDPGSEKRSNGSNSLKERGPDFWVRGEGKPQNRSRAPELDNRGARIPRLYIAGWTSKQMMQSGVRVQWLLRARLACCLSQWRNPWPFSSLEECVPWAGGRRTLLCMKQWLSCTQEKKHHRDKLWSREIAQAVSSSLHKYRTKLGFPRPQRIQV